MGAISYTLYLVHQNIGYVIIRSLEQAGASPELAILTAIVATVLLAVALHYGVERPAMKSFRTWRPGFPKLSRLRTAATGS